MASLGFDTPTAVQEQAIPPLLAGRDVIGRARTGSGKTAAFGLPLLERVKEGGAARALVLAPTRELALQVGDALRSFAKRIKGVRIVTVYGGAPYPPQLKALRAGASVVVGTPGRIIDHLERGSLDLSAVEYVVLDEADEMLRMGFLDDVEKLLRATPETRQVALFSATMPDAIQKVARTHLRDPIELQVESGKLTVEHIQQCWIRVPERFKLDALVRVLRGLAHGTTLVFARTRVDCADLADALAERGVAVEALHGDLSQPARERVVQGLRSRRLRVVIATDVAARGIDVDHITHVINVDLPPDAESYVHRIGRTARAGREGTAISFVTPRAVGRLEQLRRTLKVPIEAMEIPSDADIARIERGRIKDDVLRAAEEGGLDAAAALLDEALADSPFGLEQLAAAALRLLATEVGVTLDAMPREGRPAWASAPERRERPGRERPGRERAGRDGPGAERGPRRDGPDETQQSQLFFPLGFARGVRPADLVGLLANEADISPSSIGRITILAHKSFVGVSEAVAEHVLSVLPKVNLRGTVVSIRLARGQGDEPAARPRPAREGDGTRGGDMRPPERPSKRPSSGGGSKAPAKKPRAKAARARYDEPAPAAKRPKRKPAAAGAKPKTGKKPKPRRS